jgi:hypothetical protein
MKSDEPTDQDLAEQALSQLDVVEPSAALLRRVARIPLDETRLPVRSPWSLWGPWPIRALIFASLALGAVVGAVPWDPTASTNASELMLAEPDSGEDAELESTLSAALGGDWDQADALLEEAL